MKIRDGHTKSLIYRRTYNTWRAMRNRCMQLNRKDSRSYSEKGINHCPKWNSFHGFVEDMGIRPPNMTLDRINNNLDYRKSNCRWATKSIQMENRDAISKSGHKHIAIKGGSFVVQFYFNGKIHRSFKTLREAIGFRDRLIKAKKTQREKFYEGNSSKVR